MANNQPGSPSWWFETAAITCVGLVLAAWLWTSDGVQSRPDTAPPTPMNLGELLEAGCLTAGDLAALRDGARFTAACPPE